MDTLTIVIMAAIIFAVIVFLATKQLSKNEFTKKFEKRASRR